MSRCKTTSQFVLRTEREIAAGIAATKPLVFGIASSQNVTTISRAVLSLLIVLPAAAAHADTPRRAVTKRAVYKLVQPTPTYDLQRPELTIGTRITIFANFLQKDPGVVLLDIGATTTNCTVLEWKPQSVTVQLPRLGLSRPQAAKLRVVLPNGRIAKSHNVVLVAQPDIVVHEETIAQPMPPAPAASATQAPAPAVYAESIEGGFVFYSE